MISVTFPDGASRAFEPGVSGLDIAKSISPSLAKRTVAMTLDGELVDLAESITKDSKIEFVARDDARALEFDVLGLQRQLEQRAFGLARGAADRTRDGSSAKNASAIRSRWPAPRQ